MDLFRLFIQFFLKLSFHFCPVITVSTPSLLMIGHSCRQAFVHSSLACHYCMIIATSYFPLLCVILVSFIFSRLIPFKVCFCQTIQYVSIAVSSNPWPTSFPFFPVQHSRFSLVTHIASSLLSPVRHCESSPYPRLILSNQSVGFCWSLL